MEKLIKKIHLLRKENKLTSVQSITLFSMKFGIYDVDILAEDLFDLRKRGLIKGNKLTGEAHELIDEILTRRAGSKKQTASSRAYNSSKPVITKETAEIVKELGKHFIGNRFNGDMVLEVSEYTKSNPLMAPFLFMFMEMFPSSVRSKNANWNKHFGSEYEGVTLRRYTQDTSNKLMKIWRKHDIGLFLLGTYMYIQSTKSSDGNYYVMKISNYLKEWEHWYSQAKEMNERGDLNSITSRARKSINANTFVV